MINLIPKLAKRKLKYEYWGRVIIVWSLCVSTALVIGATLLVPTYVLIGMQVDTYEPAANKAAKLEVDYEKAALDLIRSSQQARIVVDETNVLSISSYLELIEELQGEGINLTNIQVGRNADRVTLSAAVVSGVASNRLALASFRDRLLASEKIEEAELPISDLARDVNISFNISIKFSDLNQASL